MFKTIAIGQSVLILLINPIIVLTVLRSMKRVMGGRGRDKAIKIFILGLLFELCLILRIPLILKEE